MADLSDRTRTLLGAIRLNATAWQTPQKVAERLGWSVDETTDLLAELDLAGLIVVREPDDSDPLIALVPLAAGHGNRSREMATTGRAAVNAVPRNPGYGRSSRPRSSATAAGSVAS